jgi:hypothetical protein
MKLLPLRINLNLVDCCATGFWFCGACQHITEREERGDGLAAHCWRCGSPRIKWWPPIEGYSPAQNEDQKVPNPV